MNTGISEGFKAWTSAVCKARQKVAQLTIRSEMVKNSLPINIGQIIFALNSQNALNQPELKARLTGWFAEVNKTLFLDVLSFLKGFDLEKGRRSFTFGVTSGR